MQKKEDFMRRYAGVYDHAPWISEAAFAADATTPEAVHMAMKAAVMSASHDRKQRLIRAYPDFSSPVLCPPAEEEEIARLNAEYKNKFGFPFVMATRGLTLDDILPVFRNRLRNNPPAEFENALEQIHKIAWHRIQALG